MSPAAVVNMKLDGVADGNLRVLGARMPPVPFGFAVGSSGAIGQVRLVSYGPDPGGVGWARRNRQGAL